MKNKILLILVAKQEGMVEKTRKKNPRNRRVWLGNNGMKDYAMIGIQRR